VDNPLILDSSVYRTKFYILEQKEKQMSRKNQTPMAPKHSSTFKSATLQDKTRYFQGLQNYFLWDNNFPYMEIKVS